MARFDGRLGMRAFFKALLRGGPPGRCLNGISAPQDDSLVRGPGERWAAAPESVSAAADNG